MVNLNCLIQLCCFLSHRSVCGACSAKVNLSTDYSSFGSILDLSCSSIHFLLNCPETVTVRTCCCFAVAATSVNVASSVSVGSDCCFVPGRVGCVSLCYGGCCALALVCFCRRRVACVLLVLLTWNLCPVLVWIPPAFASFSRPVSL